MAGTRGNRAVIYVRESLDKWGDARAVERFEAECRHLCGARGLTVLRVLRDNDVRASGGNKGGGFAEVLRMLRARETDYVVIPVVDRMFRNLRDLEDVIDICLETGAALVAASGEIDLSHDQGRLVARLLTSVAKAETERKGERQRRANEQAARSGKRWSACPRPFGYARPDYTAAVPAEADAIRWAADALLGGGTVAAVTREWNARKLTAAQSGKPFSRASVTMILRNPRLAGLACLPRRDGERHGEIIGKGDWEPILPEETWRAVDALLADPSRKRPRGVRTLLGGLAACQCGNTVTGSVSRLGHHIYRCQPDTRNGRPGPHATVRAEPVDEFTERVVLEVLSSPDLADIVAGPPPHADTVALRKEAAAIRANLEEMGEDRALGLVSRAQMLAGTETGNRRLAEIAAELAEAAGAGALAPFLVPGAVAAEVWDGLDLSRRREVVRTIGHVTLLPAGQGARVFDARKVRFLSPSGTNLGERITNV